MVKAQQGVASGHHELAQSARQNAACVVERMVEQKAKFGRKVFNISVK